MKEGSDNMSDIINTNTGKNNTNTGKNKSHIKKNIAIVGASGLVGRTMLQVLAEREYSFDSIRLFASSRSAGVEMEYLGKTLIVEELTNDSFDNTHIALFSAGGETSKKFAPIAADAGCLVIDNSSVWRMVDGVPLVVPEVNPLAAKDHKNIIANPNCSTIQLTLPIKIIYDNFGLKRLVVSTYQSISGAGQSGIDMLMNEINNLPDKDIPSIAFNTMFHPFEDNGNTVEENKMLNEMKKIFSDDSLNISVTCVRLPILGGHAESVNFTTKKELDIDRLLELFVEDPNIVVLDNPTQNIYATPRNVKDDDRVFVSRLRKDLSEQNSANLWVVADNLRKGAATNAVQIAELVLENDWL